MLEALFMVVVLQLRSTYQSASLASTGKSYSGLCSTALAFIARYRKFLTFIVVFRLPPKNPIWVKQGCIGFNLMFLL